MNLYELFIAPYESYETYQIILEVIATTFGLISVYFSMNKNILVYPMGIISTCIYVYLLIIFGLLGDLMINIYYTIMSIYGWILWSKNTNNDVHVKVSSATKKDWYLSGLFFVISLLLVSLVYFLKPYFNNQFSMDGVILGFQDMDWANWLDIFTTSIFLIGMWLMANRKIENWLFWIVGDVISVPLYIYKGLGITSVQFLVFTILAIIGYQKWSKENKKITE